MRLRAGLAVEPVGAWLCPQHRGEEAPRPKKLKVTLGGRSKGARGGLAPGPGAWGLALQPWASEGCAGCNGGAMSRRSGRAGEQRVHGKIQKS